MYHLVNKILDFSGPMGNKINQYISYTSEITDDYFNKSVSNTFFGKKDIYACKGNDFLYLLIRLLMAYYEVKLTENQEEEVDYDLIHEQFDLEKTRYYFHEVHDFDIVPYYEMFELVENDCTNTLFGTEADYVSLDCLFS